VTASGKTSPYTPLLKKTLPWLIAGGIFYYLFTQVPIGDAWLAARDARLEIFLPAMAAATVFWFLIDSAAFAFVFTRFNAPLSWAEARSLRGVTYFVTPINWNVGTAAVILHLRTSKKIAALDSTSTMFFYQTIDGMVLAGSVLAGVLLLPETSETVSLRNAAIGFECFQVSILAVTMGQRPSWRWLDRLRGLGLFRSHQKANGSDLLVLFGLKGIYFAGWVGLFWLGCHAFGVSLPFHLALAATPAILMAAAIPITPAGLGTQQAAMLYFFSPYGDEAAILAFGISFPVALILFRCLIGLRYLGDVGKLRRSMREEIPKVETGD
jgi:uncharacterized membrane protein YbhN (UPF0104 family)